MAKILDAVIFLFYFFEFLLQTIKNLIVVSVGLCMNGGLYIITYFIRLTRNLPGQVKICCIQCFVVIKLRSSKSVGCNRRVAALFFIFYFINLEVVSIFIRLRFVWSQSRPRKFIIFDRRFLCRISETLEEFNSKAIFFSWNLIMYIRCLWYYNFLVWYGLYHLRFFVNRLMAV